MPHAHLDLPGSAGVLEARLDEAATPGGMAVLCHPHPSYGGNMNDGVLAVAAEVMLKAGLSCLRFNFRGVGNSAGEHDEGKGEVDDVLAAMAAARTHQGNGPLWLLGYSFGAAMAWAAARQQRPEGLILIAPPVGLMDFSGGLREPLEVHVMLGDHDDFAPLEDVEQWAGSLEPAASIHPIDGADHFFHGHNHTLADAIATALGKA